ncbi:MAG: type II toxin-antitoxin system VapC family toxin [Chloroflexi bacterium]|nr:type II toxin-antitoxin system VapC family toxin [Chloroflexota bacterium]MBI2851009.1 type II toxin-antitoxin system VapC family toxin [Chloroflexota bacterium]
MQIEVNRLQSERFVLDSYAVLALLEGAEGHERVGELLQKALVGQCELFMSIVNLGEVLYITERERGLPKAQEVLARIDELPIKVIDVNRAHALTTAHIKAQWPIAYADCFVAALAKLKGATIVTGDPEFKHLEAASVVPIAWLEAK